MSHQGGLQRGLKDRHVQLIAFGGSIGTGLFLGLGKTIQMAGPAVLLSYAIGGLIAFLILRQLGEMMTEEPIAGSFSNLANKYWGGFAGFLSGWNYWLLYVLVAMSELTAVTKYVSYWYPEDVIAPWQIVAFFFILITAINFAAVKIYGELEFWFSIIKVVTVVGVIILGSYLLLSGTAGPSSHISNLWEHDGFFPFGLSGVFFSLAFVMFSFGGLELVGIAAAETDNPKRTIPKAVNQIIYRILIFYIGAVVIFLSLYPWNQLIPAAGSDPMASSPFVMVFSKIGIHGAAAILNAVVLTAALSVYNSCVYCNSRMLYGLALQGNAPKAFATTDRRGVPVPALLLSAGATLICVLLNYLLPEKALEILMSLVIASLVINWGMISLTHLFFRSAKVKEGITPSFKALIYPYGNYICLLFMGIILYILAMTGFAIPVAIIPTWICFIGGLYWVKKQGALGQMQLYRAAALFVATLAVVGGGTWLVWFLFFMQKVPQVAS